MLNQLQLDLLLDKLLLVVLLDQLLFHIRQRMLKLLVHGFMVGMNEPVSWSFFLSDIMVSCSLS